MLLFPKRRAGEAPEDAVAALSRAAVAFPQTTASTPWTNGESSAQASPQQATIEAAERRLSLQALIDQVPDNLWVKDVNSRFVIANKATALRIGVDGTDDLIGRTDFELCPPEKAEQYFADEQRIIRSGQPMVDKEEVAAYGEKTWILTTKVPLRNEQNEIFGLIGVSRDISERRKADILRKGQADILEMIASGAPWRRCSTVSRVLSNCSWRCAAASCCWMKTNVTCAVARRQACRQALSRRSKRRQSVRRQVPAEPRSFAAPP